MAAYPLQHNALAVLHGSFSSMCHRPGSSIRSARHGVGEQPAIPQAVSPLRFEIKPGVLANHDREVATTSSLMDMTPGPAIGRRRMDAARDTRLRELIDEHDLKPARLSPEAIYREARYRRQARTAASRRESSMGRFRQLLLRGGGEQA